VIPFLKWCTQCNCVAPPFGFLVYTILLIKKKKKRKRRAIIINKCCMCKRDGESVDRLLIHCDIASALWSAIFSRFGLAWIMPRRVLDLCASWWSWTRNAVVWKMVPICLFWTLWRERNNRCFENLENSMEDILASMLNTLYMWTAAYLAPFPLTYADFLVRFSFSN
jgi:hypothetical protein